MESIREIKKISEQINPNFLVSIDQFALDKTKETISNVAIESYKKFGDTSPMLNLENIYPGTVFSRGESLKELIKETRNAFVEKAVKNGVDKEKAKKAAENIIGATWDVGHINLGKKHGMTDKDILEDTKAIAPYIKHVHLTDNFGISDSHLVPGMGNVPFKEIFKELEKVNYKGKEILEIGGFPAQGFGSPTAYALESMGSSLYDTGGGPSWNRMDSYSNGVYSMGYGLMLPEQHFSMYGSGFSSLPTELGGQMPGKGQRFSGAPME